MIIFKYLRVILMDLVGYECVYVFRNNRVKMILKEVMFVEGVGILEE